MEHADFLVEIGCEELPPKALASLSGAFHELVCRGLDKAGLSFSDTHAYAAPRRLAVKIDALQTRQADSLVERRGPALNAAFNGDGNPTPAASGFARSCGVAVDALEKLETDKGTWLVFKQKQPGLDATTLLPDIISAALAGLPIPRRMRWGDGTAEFVRPVHWVIMLLGKEVVPCRILGIAAGQASRGHRFHHPAPLTIVDPASYAPLLESNGYVMVDYAQRRTAIRAQVEAAGREAGGQAVIDETLLDEVTSLVEWPHAITGRFDKDFLQVPAEALISSMQGHQKYFPVVDAKQRLLPCFITVANIQSKNIASVIAGNERVIRPRLSDAVFFWGQDRKTSLHHRLDSLKQVVFQKKLGSLHDKARRVSHVAAGLAELLGSDKHLAARAGLLSKSDLMTEMVGEFPELQGVMGRYYARHDGEPVEVATALEQQYWPRQAGDAVADQATAQAVAIADKLDTIVGIFGIGQIPTGVKDPFALRRAALGLMRTIIENALPLTVTSLLDLAITAYGAVLSIDDTLRERIGEFLVDRLKAYYADQGIAPDTFESVQCLRPDSPRDFHRRLLAVQAFRKLAEAGALAAANKRIANLLRKSGAGTGDADIQIDSTLLQEPAEQALYQALQDSQTQVLPLFEHGDYEQALQHLSRLRTPVDGFFDQVMVMAEDPALQQNRLNLLRLLTALFLRVADVGRLQH